MSRNLTPEPVATGSAETRIGQLRWREYGGPREAAGERTLLFVHGLLTNSDVWGEVVQNLSQDFRCITLDIPLGSHTIPAREDAALTVAELAQAVNEAAEQLCHRLRRRWPHRSGQQPGRCHRQRGALPGHPRLAEGP